MRWGAVLRAIWKRAQTDPTLVGIYGAEYIRKQGIKEFRVPSMEYMLVGDTESELWAPHVVQWTQWTRTLQDIETSSHRLHALFHHDTPVFIEGIYMWAVYLDGGDLEGPAREGFHGLASRFRFTPIRAKLVSRGN